MNIKLRKFPYRYMPYEARLLATEARLVGKIEANSPGHTVVTVPSNKASFTKVVSSLPRLTYFSHYQIGNAPFIPTQQFLMETTANGGVAPSRQSTRYSSHGLHEYKGKFNPQIARHLMNRAGIGNSGIVLDPFAGSGTVLLEALHFGCNAIGIEANPLGVAIGNAKILLVSSNARTVAAFKAAALKAANAIETEKRPTEKLAADVALTEAHLDYLKAWFSPPILHKMLAFRSRCKASMSSEWAGVADVLVSSIARDVSHQDPADLRIRRRKQPLSDAPIADMLSAKLQTIATRSTAAQNLLAENQVSAFEFIGDSRKPPIEFSAALKELGRTDVDLIITSPPYANAMPYVDTSRLSLVLLGLALPTNLKLLEKAQIGNREISPSERKRLNQEIEAKLDDLTPVIAHFVRKLLRLLGQHAAGFRKQNVPALLVEYFTSMKQVLCQCKALLSKDGTAYWVVGPNRTQIGDQELAIETPGWIVSLAEAVGLSSEIEPLDAYQRFGLHQRNGIRKEFLLVFRPNQKKP